MPDFANLTLIATAFFVAAASPGPATIAAATVSMSEGRKGGLLFGLGLSTGLAFWGLVAATGLGAVLQSSLYMLPVLKALGGMYLLWLAFAAARSASRPDKAESPYSANSRFFTRGLLLNLSNPKAVFAWMAVLALGLGPENGQAHLVLATLSCMATGLGIYVAYAFAFSTPGVMAAYRKARRWVEGVVAGLFALAGFGLLRSALER